MENLTEQILPSERRIFCNHCRKAVIPKLSKAGPHIRADCSSCNRFLKFAKQDRTAITPEEKEAGDKYFLKYDFDTDVPPGSYRGVITSVDPKTGKLTFSPKEKYNPKTSSYETIDPKDYDPKEKGLDNIKGGEIPPWE